jgi:hypothetical protein
MKAQRWRAMIHTDDVEPFEDEPAPDIDQAAPIPQ